ncbi:hypothetical protein BFN03_13580 [Rhodococcus sp. WMMA185]|uniref:hypothetical protein n=1 Tax=Rhodococcus sp. WMMA185 TaxID=679318 RepID=UPI00087D03EE|nr:hypothetical protein [Rhodococcus sp. WMMA185]AOW93332.1 hypothetical protein BFN03_13580 [Rhodococcus sp. WMMA185]
MPAGTNRHIDKPGDYRKKLATTAAAAAALVAGALGAATLSAPPAQAVSISASNVKYVFCSANQYGNNLEYEDSYGTKQIRNAVLPNKVDDSLYCGTVDVYLGYDEYGHYVSAWITNESSAYVYAAIYSVYPATAPLFGSLGGREHAEYLQARDENYSSYGGYNYAGAY